MARALTAYTVVLGLFELPTILMLLCGGGGGLAEVTPWFDSAAPFERHSYACMYAGVLALLATSRFLAAYLPRHRLIQVHNALVHALELGLFLLLWSLRRSPASAVCYALAAVMAANCVLFGMQAFKALTPANVVSLREKKNN
ncbi:uncharacterized protein Tco025E_05753 [Trypanosoma conorhini]|uniref:Transmembrane protein n=1 Tax=Trypanosoma conorhini TaxID=83891 RepID=A0A3R7LI10_9TRYP|nr:uncharacterized protein Tco025E_05753 [Trypanosoma conorhini]RNF14859.1 hypothetical protein Tco025E_05753 [Trypanosoma conorhini]